MLTTPLMYPEIFLLHIPPEECTVKNAILSKMRTTHSNTRLEKALSDANLLRATSRKFHLYQYISTVHQTAKTLSQ